MFIIAYGPGVNLFTATVLHFYFKLHFYWIFHYLIIKQDNKMQLCSHEIYEIIGIF